MAADDGRVQKKSKEAVRRAHGSKGISESWLNQGNEEERGREGQSHRERVRVTEAREG